MYQFHIAVVMQCISRHPRPTVVESALCCPCLEPQFSLGSQTACSQCTSSVPGTGSRPSNTASPNRLWFTVQQKNSTLGDQSFVCYLSLLAYTVDCLKLAVRDNSLFTCGSHHRVHRVATATSWHTFHHDGKISLGWWGWGVHAHLPTPLHSVYHHVQSCSVRTSWEGRYTHLFLGFSPLPLYMYYVDFTTDKITSGWDKDILYPESVIQEKPLLTNKYCLTSI